MTEDSMHRTLDAALARNSGPSAEDVEALAGVLHRKLCCDNPGHADWTNCPIDGPCSEDARAVLASDWLAAHTAAAKREGARAVAVAIENVAARRGERTHRLVAAAREAAARVEGGA